MCICMIGIVFLPHCLAAVSNDTSKMLVGRPAELSAAEIRHRMQVSQQSITSVSVVYRAIPARELASGYFPTASYNRIGVAGTVEGYCYHSIAHSHAALDWTSDPLQRQFYLSPDNQWYVANPVNRTFSRGQLKPDDRLPVHIQYDLFLSATGIWPFAQRPPAQRDDRPYVLRDVAQSADYSVVDSEQECVFGRWCHILEHPGRDRLWLDVERGCALLARETIGTAGALQRRVELADHIQLTDEVWLPRRLRNIEYDYLAAIESERQRRVQDTTAEVLHAVVNDVDYSLFQYRPSAGSLEMSATTALRQAVPGGLDHLETLVDFVRAGADTSSAGFGWIGTIVALLPVPIIPVVVMRRVKVI